MNNPNQLLHYQFTPSSSPNDLPTIVFIHGLFGDLNNLGVIARAFVENYPILRLDLRNHGQSFQSEIMDYPLMAQDVLRLLDALQLEQIIVVGHSMGGKVAMQLAALQPNRIKRLIVIDMAPITYPSNGHNDVFAGLFAVKNASVTTRQQAKPLLAEHIHSESVQQFMLKSFDANSSERFRFHLSALWQNYPNLMAWQPIQYNQPTLFIFLPIRIFKFLFHEHVPFV